jgi:DNA-binding PucR family transcriptional regulator
LLCYFDCQHNITLAAETLGVHVNTMRQRLETLREITGGWDDPVKALELHVALRLRAIME